MRTRTDALAALKISVGRRYAAIVCLKDIAVHRQAERAAGFPPLPSRMLKDLVQALFFGLLSNLHRTRHNRSGDTGVYLSAFEYGGRCAKVFDSGIRAGTDKRVGDRDAGNFFSGFQSM